MSNDSRDGAKVQGFEGTVARPPAILDSGVRSQGTKSVHFHRGFDSDDIAGISARDHGDSAATAWSGKTLLSLDGGGVRGLSSLVILSALMKVIQREEVKFNEHIKSSADSPLLESVPDSVKGSEYLPCHYFDFICGTSTGGLIAILLGRKRMSVHDCCEKLDGISRLLEPSIIAGGISHFLSFNFTRSWSTSRCGKAIDEVFSEQPSTDRGSDDRQFGSNPSLCKTIVLAVQMRGGMAETHLFRSYENDSLMQSLQTMAVSGGNKKISVAQVAKACTAPPSFKPYKIEHTRYKDGSSWNLNPVRVCLEETINFRAKGELSVDLILSTGTSVVQSKSLGPLRRMSSKMYTSPEQHIDYPLPDGYWRFDIDAHIDQTASGRTIQDRLRKATSEYLERTDDKERLIKVARILVRRRRERAKTAAWESFALNVAYVCNKPDCPYTEKRFKSRARLLRHWIIEHEYDRPDALTQKKVEAELDQCREWD
ncbi:acyl transferase/acyl hydrolase/lysophospholipase [Phaeosphaeria sp. MPI-PUGE-AT-0046c]|nr:acyl transferase/acyl hydrolase/lysophospholipase [Phaeosphaeria sp. MPI-PUGE-AT-0046c]